MSKSYIKPVTFSQSFHNEKQNLDLDDRIMIIKSTVQNTNGSY